MHAGTASEAAPNGRCIGELERATHAPPRILAAHGSTSIRPKRDHYLPSLASPTKELDLDQLRPPLVLHDYAVAQHASSSP
ncbi:hypothetical protein L7F22_040441, partial [Adiantum nelumboides]|nr:hypothetical protein [Adiantum nelumboides]